MTSETDTKYAALATVAKAWGIEHDKTIGEIGLKLADKLRNKPIRKDILEAFRIVHDLKLSRQEYPLPIIEQLIGCLKLSLTYDYKLEILNLLLTVASEERGLRNILRCQGEQAIFMLLGQSEEILKSPCFNLLIRLSQSLRGRVVILDCLSTPGQLLVHLKKSESLALLVLELISSLLGVPPARPFFDTPELVGYLNQPTENAKLKCYKQLVSWLLKLPVNRLLDHLAEPDEKAEGDEEDTDGDESERSKADSSSACTEDGRKDYEEENEEDGCRNEVSEND